MILWSIPRRLFEDWVAIPFAEKLSEDLILLYSVLAVGVVPARDSGELAYKHALAACHMQVTATATCLQLVQTRAVLALYFLLNSRPYEAS
jgi:hypothetical protein